MLANSSDSYFRHVKERIAVSNPARQVVAVLDAMDWPPQNIILEGLYLLLLDESPLGRSMDSAAVPVVERRMQWTWIIVGTDLSAGLVGRNRGDAYRTNEQIKTDLLYGHFPRNCEKKAFSLSGTDLVATSLDPKEFVWWSPLSFRQRSDRASGTLYGTASFSLTDMTDTIAA